MFTPRGKFSLSEGQGKFQQAADCRDLLTP